MNLTVTPLSSGYHLIRGSGPSNWAQVPHWPCTGEVIREHAFPEASEAFLQAAEFYAGLIADAGVGAPSIEEGA